MFVTHGQCDATRLPFQPQGIRLFDRYQIVLVGNSGWKNSIMASINNETRPQMTCRAGSRACRVLVTESLTKWKRCWRIQLIGDSDTGHSTTTECSPVNDHDHSSYSQITAWVWRLHAGCTQPTGLWRYTDVYSALNVTIYWLTRGVAVGKDEATARRNVYISVFAW